MFIQPCVFCFMAVCFPLLAFIHANNSCSVMCNAVCICSQTVFILCFNVIPHPTERLAPVDFPSLCNSGSEVKSGMCQHLSVLGVVNPAAEPEVPKYTGCLGNLGYQADFYSVNMLCGLVSLLFARFFFVYSFLGRSVFLGLIFVCCFATWTVFSGQLQCRLNRKTNNIIRLQCV